MWLFPQLDKTKLFDSHAHISSSEFENDRDQIITNAKINNIEYIFDIAVNFEYSKKSIELSKKYPGKVFSFIGIDPEVFIQGSPFFIGFDKNEEWFEDQNKQLQQLITQNSEFIIGIGESGMDHYHNRELNTDDRLQSNRLQEQLFRMHLELAQEFKLPLSIHSRFAEEECLEIVKKYDVRGIFHSYTGSYETAKQILNSGWGLGVNGIITFKKAEELRNVYRKILGKIPQDVTPDYFYDKGIYFETDSPYLSPEGKRGERNEPGNIRMTYDNFCKMLK